MIENVAAKLPEWTDRNYEGLTKEELKAACRHLEISINSNDTIDSLTRKLLQSNDAWDVPGGSDAASAPAKKAATKTVKQGTIPAKPVPKPPKVTPIVKDRKRQPPNLRSLAKWEGRRYRIRALAQDKERGGARSIPVPWENEVYWLNPKKRYQDVPAPVFHNIVDSQAQELILEWNAEAKVTERSWNTFARFPIQFMGVSPGTAHLPEDLRGWYIEDALAHDLYANESRDQLERIWMQLTDGHRPNDRDRDRNRDYWIYEILQLLGLTPEQQEALADMDVVEGEVLPEDVLSP